MPHPVSPAGRRGLAALLAEPHLSLVALDYDGTLAPIVDRPQDAVPQEGALEVLHDLAGRVGRLAVVTGRPALVVVELAGLQDVPGLVVLGQYGVQRWQAGHLVQEPPVPGIARARAALAGLTLEEGVEVEDKQLSLVVHTRQAADPPGALARLHPAVDLVAARSGMELHSGRLVLELRPPGHDKGRALASLTEGMATVLYAGDDRGDLAAFDAADHLRDSGTEVLLVCSDSDEAPEELRVRADLVVAGPAGVVQLLEDFAARF